MNINLTTPGQTSQLTNLTTTEENSTIFIEDGLLMISDMKELKKRFKREKLKQTQTQATQVMEPAPMLLNMNDSPKIKKRIIKRKRKLHRTPGNHEKTGKLPTPPAKIRECSDFIPKLDSPRRNSNNSPKKHSKKHHKNKHAASLSRLSPIPKINNDKFDFPPPPKPNSMFRSSSNNNILNDEHDKVHGHHNRTESAEFRERKGMISKHDSMIFFKKPTIPLSASAQASLNLITTGLHRSPMPMIPTIPKVPKPLVTCVDDVTLDATPRNSFSPKTLGKRSTRRKAKSEALLVSPVPQWPQFQVDLLQLPDDSEIELAASKKYNISLLVKSVKEQ
ncbi:hypothetical protein TVAG_042780 [Trichomonas vaginalis G3]|uniref:Uncharacterized protein n=1 Tax=Trichomonas vaginalis (strain ATCC PRA-98 / G3) TaxID=412133 RepID=A2FQ40_TRIV3|nr:hypothetical protein TVAGG3_1026050 [Trichomonas vaginalis G3]EAX92979.1 hypothetical protein TVAG_042780 [Trichomonas vaginalis G3]KAI5492503.1 hypothetical protein TVAGG3_1026050 [Trichomonas vaginalis G3]|eukprot:XP_001305909.1 hypothetical protein [Trichomonas vaginalis G3]